MTRIVTLSKPGGLENLKLGNMDLRDPGAGEIQVKVQASSLNYHDYFVVKGYIPAADGRIPLSDGAGEVTKIGEGVSEFAPGDHVVSAFYPDIPGRPAFPAGMITVPGDGADGFAAEYVTRPAYAFTRAPANLDAREAATLTCAGLTAWRALVVNGGLKAGDQVLVQGTGGVSIFALQFAKMFGATVIATSASDAKLDRLKSLGADHVINYKREPEWGKAALELSGGGVDHVIEVGGAGTLPQSITAATLGGHIAIIGILAGMAGEISMATVMGKQLRLIGLTVGSRHQQQDMVRAIQANDLHPVLDQDFPLEKLAEAFRYQESQQHFGKITVSMA